MTDRQQNWHQWGRRGSGKSQPLYGPARMMPRSGALQEGPGDTPCRIGELAAQTLRAVNERSALQERVWAVLAQHGGLELLEQARLLGVRAGKLTFQVAEPAVLYQLRIQWEQRILELMRCCLPNLGINAVRFLASQTR